MDIIGEIKSKLKLLISDLRRHLGLIFIISIIWVLLLIGILFLAIYVGPLQPLPEITLYLDPYFVALITGAVKVAMAGMYVLVWLYIWHRMVRMYFWRTIDKYCPEIELKPEEKE